jgi:hypothetical protein
MAPIIRFALSEAISVGVGVVIFESTDTRMYPFNGNRALEYLFSISDTRETTASMETASPNVALVCVTSTSVINSQTVLLISAEPSSSSQSTLPPPDTSSEDVTAYRRLKKVSPLPGLTK